MEPPASFPLFPLLPTEIRLKIWSYTLATPRTIRIACTKGLSSPSPRRRYFAAAFTSSSPAPAPLHVCREARAEALARYTPLFRTALSDAYTYVCLEQDVVAMADTDIAYLREEEQVGIRRMRLDVRDFANFSSFNMDTILQMKGLAELDILTEEESQSRRGARHPDLLELDFEDERRADPGWACPRVRILGRDTGKVYGAIEGGALVPGWKAGDPVPDV